MSSIPIRDNDILENGKRSVLTLGSTRDSVTLKKRLWEERAFITFVVDEMKGN